MAKNPLEEWSEGVKNTYILSAHFETLGQTITLVVERNSTGYIAHAIANGKVQDSRSNFTLVGTVLDGVQMMFSEFNAFGLLTIDT